MAKYSDIKGFTVQTVTSDPAASVAASGSWAAGGNVNTARSASGGAGTQTAGFIFGGYSGSPSAVAEQYNGSSWTEVADLNTARYALAGLGTQPAALAAGGHTGSIVNNAETWNGSAWTEVNELNTAREALNSKNAGTSTAGLIWGRIHLEQNSQQDS